MYVCTGDQSDLLSIQNACHVQTWMDGWMENFDIPIHPSKHTAHRDESNEWSPIYASPSERDYALSRSVNGG